MEETKTFTKYVGGSPANIAIGAARLGLKPVLSEKYQMIKWAASLLGIFKK